MNGWKAYGGGVNMVTASDTFAPHHAQLMPHDATLGVERMTMHRADAPRTSERSALFEDRPSPLVDP